MNSLTKDELKEIHDLLLHGFGESVKRVQTFQKIKNMIENYCEIEIPTLAKYCCDRCNEEWAQCECKIEDGKFLVLDPALPDLKICPECQGDIVQDIFSRPKGEKGKGGGRLLEARACCDCKIIYEVVCD